MPHGFKKTCRVGLASFFVAALVSAETNKSADAMSVPGCMGGNLLAARVISSCDAMVVGKLSSPGVGSAVSVQDARLVALRIDVSKVLFGTLPSGTSAVTSNVPPGFVKSISGAPVGICLKIDDGGVSLVNVARISEEPHARYPAMFPVCTVEYLRALRELRTVALRKSGPEDFSAALDDALGKASDDREGGAVLEVAFGEWTERDFLPSALDVKTLASGIRLGRTYGNRAYGAIDSRFYCGEGPSCEGKPQVADDVAHDEFLSVIAKDPARDTQCLAILGFWRGHPTAMKGFLSPDECMNASPGTVRSNLEFWKNYVAEEARRKK